MRVMLAHKLYKVTGGSEVFFLETGRILRDHGHDVFNICSGNPVEAPSDARFMEAPEYNGVGLLSKIRNLPTAIYDTSKKAQLIEVIQAFKPDVFHAFDLHVHLTPSLLVAAHEAGVPVVLTCNDYRHICPNYKLFHHDRICFDCKGERFFKAIQNKCCKEQLGLSLASAVGAYAHDFMGIYDRYVDVFTFSSDFMAGITQEFWSHRSIAWGKLRNPFNSAAFSPSMDYEAYGLFFGRLIEEKGVDRLLEAATQINGFPIKIVGTGPNEEKLRSISAERHIENVEFVGPKWGAELDELLRRARFVVVPSVWHENFPYVINQSFALARPVIASRRGGITELVEDGVRGLLYEADDIPGLAAAIRTLASDPERAAKMGTAAKAYSDALFDDEIFFADLMDIYRKARDAHPRSGR
jgi:glycosyltransferase involved in cell wall biosynthesis